MKSLFRNSILYLWGICLFAGCIERTVYHSYQSLSTERWNKNDTLLFNIPITDSIPTVFHLTAEVRNNNEYAYQNLYLVISQNIQDSTIWKTDTLELALADKEGKWKGTGWGSLFQSTLPIGSVVALHPGNYTVRISHGMKDENLIGITDVGLRIEK